MLSPDAVRFLVLVTPLLLSGPGLSQGLGTNYCTAAVNSTGAGAVMDASGSADIDLNNLVLHATGLPPNQLGIFFYGPEPAQLPFGDGFRCVGAGGIGLFRIQPPVSTGTGVMSQGVDYTNPPTSAETSVLTWWRRSCGGLKRRVSSPYHSWRFGPFAS